MSIRDFINNSARHAAAFVAPFYDVRGWSLILLCAAIELWRDPVLFWTMAGWLPLFGLISGIGVIVSRHLLPQISLGASVKSAMEEKNTAAGLVVLGLCIVLAAIFHSITILAKA